MSKKPRPDTETGPHPSPQPFDLEAILGPPPVGKGESPEAYRALVAAVTEEIKPANIFEAIWARDIAYYTWSIEGFRQKMAKLPDLSPSGNPAGYDKGERGLIALIGEADETAAARCMKNTPPPEADEEAVAALSFVDRLPEIRQIYQVMAAKEMHRNGVIREVEHRRGKAAKRRRTR